MPFTLNPDHDALFIDIDGTLLDLAATPQEVVVPPLLTRNLARLQDKLGGALAFISGRTLEDIDALFAPLQLPAAGVHGAEWRMSPHGEIHHARSLPDNLILHIKEKFASYPAILAEQKKYALALHFRRSPDLQEKIEKELYDILSGQEEAFILLQGKMVFEIMRPDYNKGVALENFMKEKPFADRKPIFIGDDETDTFAIATCIRLGGIGARVGQDTSAHKTLFTGPAAVRDWLARQLI